MDKKADWDAIVIGAGMAGLSCAAHLAMAGKRVVVLEQHYRPGGLWASFSRGGIIFDISTHWVIEPEALNGILRELGSPPVDFVRLGHLGRYLGPDRSTSWDILVGPNIEEFKTSIRQSFPTVNEEALAKLVRMALTVDDIIGSLPVYSAELTSSPSRVYAGLRMTPHLPRLLRLGRMPAERLFEHLFPGAELAGLRAALYTLAPIPGMPAIGPLAILAIGLRGKAYSPRGGCQVLADAFVGAAIRNGAEIWYSRKATSILSAEGTVQGVVLDDGSEVHAPAVVSAADAKQTFYQLLSPEVVPTWFKETLEAQPVSEPYGLISLVTDLDLGGLGFDGSDVFACPSPDVPRALESKEPENCAFLLVFPQYAEPGTDPRLRGVQIVVPAAFGWRHCWETGPALDRGVAYRTLKKEWSDTIIRRAQEYIPGLDSHLISVDVATPITMHRYTLNTDGAPVGWHYKTRRRWKQRVPFLRGLYQAGHWVGPSGAVPATRSGQWAAELVLRDGA